MCNLDRNTKLSYIAGVLDGDGSFSLIKKQEGNGSPMYYPLIQLANADRGLIDFIVSGLGGATYTRKPHTSKEGFKRQASHQWKLEKSIKCLPFLNEIAPFLIMKKERAEFLRDYIIQNPFKRGSNRITSDILMKRERSYQKMLNFNEKPTIYTEKLIQKRHVKTSQDPLFWAYVAGLMDTDGSFSIKKESKKKGCNNPVYAPSILLSMTDAKSIYHIVNNYLLGRVFVVKAKSAKNGYCFRFGIYSRGDAIDFLKRCIPYLRVKKQIAEQVLDFCENFKSYCGPRITPQSQLDFREKCYQNIIKLNNGVSKSSLIVLKPLPGDAGGNKEQAGQKPCSLNAVSGKTSKEDAVL